MDEARKSFICWVMKTGEFEAWYGRDASDAMFIDGENYLTEVGEEKENELSTAWADDMSSLGV